MDEETKEAIASILGGGRTKRKTRPDEEHKAESFAHVRPHSKHRALLDAPCTVSDTKELTAVICINTAKACIVLRAEYSSKVIDAIGDLQQKASVLWNYIDRVIELHPTLLPDLRVLLKTYYRDITVLGVQKQVKPTKFDLLMSKLDTEDKKRIYSYLSKRYHPDMPTGNKDIMTLVNLVFKGGD